MKVAVANIAGTQNPMRDVYAHKVHDCIRAVLLRGESVELDFSGVKNTVTRFMNMAFGRLVLADSSQYDGLVSIIDYGNASVGVKRLYENSLDLARNPQRVTAEQDAQRELSVLP